MEFGPRALGNRSIVFKATDKTVNDTVNKRLNRSEFMPFAPVTLEHAMVECYENYKNTNRNTDFMTTCYPCTDKMAKTSPAVVHIDKTARPQAIADDHPNKLYLGILSEYFNNTGIPSIVNTSFNNHEEPIVCKPQDALRSLNMGNVDMVVTNLMIISKKS